MSYALLFSGQANQHADMLPWLETERASGYALALMATHLGADWRQQMHNPATKSNNRFAQVLITGTALAAWSALGQGLQERPAVVAGYSVGELAAFACAGVFTWGQAIALAALRAQLMTDAVAHMNTGLMAVTGLSESAVLSACEALSLECAIRVGPQHQVFAGTDASLTQAFTRLADLGAQCTRLDVRVASHASWMAGAALAFGKHLGTVAFSIPQCPVGLNALGQLSRRPDQLRDALGQQLAHTVQWSAVMDAVAERQVACVLEVGGGAALSRMWNERHPGIPARALDDFQQPQGVVDWLNKMGAAAR
jgi:[acyl-carrier-protein] S-malonyltransferase